MPPRIDDRWLWLGFGIFIFVAARGMRYAIEDIVQLTQLEPSRNESQNNEKDELPEDSNAPVSSKASSAG